MAIAGLSIFSHGKIVIIGAGRRTGVVGIGLNGDPFHQGRLGTEGFQKIFQNISLLDYPIIEAVAAACNDENHGIMAMRASKDSADGKRGAPNVFQHFIKRIKSLKCNENPGGAVIFLFYIFPAATRKSMHPPLPAQLGKVMNIEPNF